MRLRRVTHHRSAPAHLHDVTSGQRLRWSEIVSFGLVGVSLGAAVIFAFQVLADRETTASATSAALLTPIAAPIPVLTTKEDPLRAPSRFAGLAAQERGVMQASFQRVARDGKESIRPGSPLFDDRTLAAAPAAPVRPRGGAKAAAPRLAATPPIWKLEESWRLARSERMRLLAQRRKRLRERMCLAKAI